MSAKRAISNPVSGPPTLPYSSGIEAGGFVFLAGQLGVNPADGKLAEGLEAQTRQVFANIEALLKQAGLGLNDVVRSTVFLADVADFQEMNKIYAEYFSEPRPARSTVGAAMARAGALIEIEVTAVHQA
ncbi:MAG: RidA family protein [Chloroflexi bacterium]|nr:RidA family protein [Chloroflexota bacterium]